MLDKRAQRDPAVAEASPAGWRAWALFLLTRGQERLAALGLALVAGFVAGLLALYAFAGLAEGVMERETQHFDEMVLALLRQAHSPMLDAVAHGVSFLGSEMVAILLVVALVCLVWRGRWGAATGLLLTTGGAQLLNNVLKDLFQRTRPAPVEWLLIPAQAWSFPSGHAMVSAAFYLFLAYLGWRVLRGRARVLWALTLLTLMLAVGWSRLYLGVHYLTDVVAGYVAGFLWTDAVIIGGHLLGRRGPRRARGARVPAPDAARGAPPTGRAPGPPPAADRSRPTPNRIAER